MTTLEKLSNYLAKTPSWMQQREGVASLVIEAKAEIERLEKQLDTSRMELQRLQEIVSPVDAESIERVLKETL